MSNTIQITTETRGICGVAECRYDKKTYYKEERTIALALSELVKQLNTRGATGVRWVADCGLSGNVGESTKARRRRSVSEMDTFELIGGQMHGDTQ